MQIRPAERNNDTDSLSFSLIISHSVAWLCTLADSNHKCIAGGREELVEPKEVVLGNIQEVKRFIRDG